MKTLTVFLMAILGVFMAYVYLRFISPVVKSFRRPEETSSHATVIPENFSSSVFCSSHENQDIECRFQNLCYHRDKFWYFNGVETVESGLPSSSLGPLILDLSSVKNHNAKYFTYTNSSSRPTYLSMHYIQKSSILFHRFNPDNLMHVIHDDLLPFFHMKRKYFPDNKNDEDIIAVWMEGRADGSFYNLYKLFMPNVLKKVELNSFTCFKDLVVGVSKSVTWYQYGFRKPQGPINVGNYPLGEIQRFKEYFVNRLMEKQESSFAVQLDSSTGVQKESIINSFQSESSVEVQQKWPSRDQQESTIVLFKRHHTRRIVNEMKIVLKLSMTFKCIVTTLDLEEDSIEHIINTILKAKILIGVHGAHLVTSLFLPPNALLVELFPFGIPSVNYTPYKTLAGLLVNVSYIAWENTREEDSLVFPERPPELGGIVHLPIDKQNEIERLKKIGKHLCCNDPFWLYRIYQDTIVDIDELIGSIRNAMDRQTL